MKYSEQMWDEVEARIHSIDSALDARHEIETYRKQQLAEKDPVKRDVLTKGLMTLQKHLLHLEGKPNDDQSYIRGAVGSDPNMEPGGSPNDKIIAESKRKRRGMAEKEAQRSQENKKHGELLQQMSDNRMNGKPF